jgi:hypothetical protein
MQKVHREASFLHLMLMQELDVAVVRSANEISCTQSDLWASVARVSLSPSCVFASSECVTARRRWTGARPGQLWAIFRARPCSGSLRLCLQDSIAAAVASVSARAFSSPPLSSLSLYPSCSEPSQVTA